MDSGAGAMQDRFQFQIDSRPAGPVRENWEEAAQDAVSAGFAVRAADYRPNSAITWSGNGGAIVRSDPNAQTVKV